MATASISLVREQTERVRPPRALWVPFPLGRPLGVPGDAEFQLNVMRAAFGMLATATEPTIEDYPIDAPGSGPEVWACPLSIAVDPDVSLTGRLQAEVDGLRPWAAETRRQRGRTFFGLSGASPDQVDEVAVTLATIAETGNLSDPPVSDAPNGGGSDDEIEWAHPMPFLIRHLADDLRGFYHEAVAARPGETPPNHDALNEWIFNETVFGEVLIAIGDHLTAAGEANPMAIYVRNFTIPEGHYRGTANFEGIPGGYQSSDAGGRGANQ